MIGVGDESWSIIKDESHPIDPFRPEAPVMNRTFGKSIQLSKGLDPSQFLSKEFPGGFPEIDFTNASKEMDSPWPEASACDQVVSESEEETFSKLMPFTGFLSAKDCPATRALELACKLNSKTKHYPISESNRMIPQRSLKRNRSLMAGFDFADLVEATKPVEESIAFPSIEWQFDEEDDNADDEAEESEPPTIGRFPFPLPEDDLDDIIDNPRAKRQCRGLVRSKHVSCNLSQLEGIS